MQHRYSAAVIVSAILSAAAPAFGQATASGNIVGTVTDTTGAALPSAQVTVTNTATDVKRTTKTNAQGEYRFDLLVPGTYSLTVQSTGFAATKVDGISLLVGSTVNENVPLKAGGAETVVEVTTSNLLLDTEKTDSGTAVTPEQITEGVSRLAQLL